MIKIYQCYFLKDQVRYLDPAFIPFDNTSNDDPEFLEYALHKKLYQFTTPDDYWGMVSWRWKEKTNNLSGSIFKNWIECHPGYDVYHFNPYLRIAATFDNCFIEGDFQHPGMMRFINLFLKEAGINLDMKNVKYPVNYFLYANYYIGNRKFWDGWMKFLDWFIGICKQNQELWDFLYKDKTNHRGGERVNFLFVFERVLSLFLFLNQDKYKVLNYPYVKELMLANHWEEDYDRYIQLIGDKS